MLRPVAKRGPVASGLRQIVRLRALFRALPSDTLTAGGGWKLFPTRVGKYGLEQDLRRRLGLAALSHELDRGVQVGLAVREPLGERKRVTGLDQNMETPTRNLFAVALVVFGDLGHVAHRREIRPFLDEPCPKKVRS